MALEGKFAHRHKDLRAMVIFGGVVLQNEKCVFKQIMWLRNKARA